MTQYEENVALKRDWNNPMEKRDSLGFNFVTEGEETGGEEGPWLPALSSSSKHRFKVLLHYFIVVQVYINGVIMMFTSMNQLNYKCKHQFTHRQDKHQWSYVRVALNFSKRIFLQVGHC